MINNVQTKPTFPPFRRGKTLVFGILAVIAYFLIFWNAFFAGAIWTSLLFMLIFFVLFHFLYLQLNKFSLKYLLLILWIFTILWCVAVGFSHYLFCLAILLLNTWIWMLAHALQDESHNKIRFDSWGYFSVGAYIFTVFFTIWYGLIFLWFYQRFPLSCQQLSDASSRVVDFFTHPVEAGATQIQQQTSAFFATKIKDVVTVSKDVSLQTTKQSGLGSIVQSINTYKKNLIDQTLKDSNLVNMGICDYILLEINKRYQNPAFLGSVILLLFLLMYGFFRIVFWVMEFLWFGIFKIMRRCRLYKVEKGMEEVERIE